MNESPELPTRATCKPSSIRSGRTTLIEQAGKFLPNNPESSLGVYTTPLTSDESIQTWTSWNPKKNGGISQL